MNPKQRNYRHCRSRHFKAIRLSRSRWRRTGIGGQSVAFGRDVITLGVGSGGGWSPVDHRPEFRPAQSLSANYVTARLPSRNCPSFMCLSTSQLRYLIKNIGMLRVLSNSPYRVPNSGPP